MTISSRTPEGEANFCPVCQQETVTEPSEHPRRDATCPHCGSLLLFGPGEAAMLAVFEEMGREEARKPRPRRRENVRT